MNVLIVEDDPMVALINKRYLEQITDIKTFGPVMYENDIIKSLKENDIDVIMITAANSTNEIKRAFAYGVVDYLVKPFEFERFKEAINKYKARKKVLLNEEVVSQSDIDSLIMNNSSENEVKLPKGLNARTLDRIIDFLNEKSNEVWTLREIAYKN